MNNEINSSADTTAVMAMLNFIWMAYIGDLDDILDFLDNLDEQHVETYNLEGTLFFCVNGEQITYGVSETQLRRAIEIMADVDRLPILAATMYIVCETVEKHAKVIPPDVAAKVAHLKPQDAGVVSPEAQKSVKAWLKAARDEYENKEKGNQS